MDQGNMNLNRAIAAYQFVYGLLGTIYGIYLLFSNIDQGLQVTLILLLFTVHDILTCMAGYRQYYQLNGWFYTSLISQLPQIGSIDITNFYLKLRCGVSINVTYDQGSFHFDTNLIDFVSALAWQSPPPATTGLNVFALLICIVLIGMRFNKPEQVN
jgi:hypothetical protein